MRDDDGRSTGLLIDRCRELGKQLVICRRRRLRRVEQQADQVCGFDRAAGAFDAGLFEFVVRVADASRVGQLKRPAFKRGSTGDDVASGSRLVEYDGSGVAEQGVDERAFSDVWPAGNDDSLGLSQVLSEARPSQKFGQSRGHLFRSERQ